jgi:hypothetical protein
MSKLSFKDIKGLAQEIAETGPDLTKASSGGGDYVPPAEGVTRLRLVGYIETGVHTTSSPRFGEKTKAKATLLFELSGPKHEPKTLDDGRKIPYIIPVDLNIGTHEKSLYGKLFRKMAESYPGTTHYTQLLGEAFLGTVVHRTYKRRDGTEGVVAELKDSNGYTIRGTTYEDPETGELRRAKVAEPISDPRVFVWDYATLEQWDSLFIDGTYDNGDTKNKWQEKIKAAENLAGSPIYQLLVEAGREDELIPAPKGQAEATDDEDTDEDPPAKSPSKAPNRAEKATKTEGEGVGSPKKDTASTARKSPPAAKPVVTKGKKAPPIPEDDEDEDDPLADL